jgi:hypothetical protein
MLTAAAAQLWYAHEGVIRPKTATSLASIG